MSFDKSVRRDSLIFDLHMNHQALDLLYFPRRIGVLVIFIMSAFTLNITDSLGYGIMVWAFLWLILRHHVIIVLQGTRIAELAGLFQFPVRWLIALVCSIYLWHVGITPKAEWYTLFWVILFDILRTFLGEVPKIARIQQNIASLSTKPPLFKMSDSSKSSDLNP
jgi:hypothetical protein